MFESIVLSGITPKELGLTNDFILMYKNKILASECIKNNKNQSFFEIYNKKHDYCSIAEKFRTQTPLYISIIKKRINFFENIIKEKNELDIERENYSNYFENRKLKPILYEIVDLNDAKFLTIFKKYINDFSVKVLLKSIFNMELSWINQDCSYKKTSIKEINLLEYSFITNKKNTTKWFIENTEFDINKDFFELFTFKPMFYSSQTKEHPLENLLKTLNVNETEIEKIKKDKSFDYRNINFYFERYRMSKNLKVNISINDKRKRSII